jgi:hypothetical protein
MRNINMYVNYFIIYYVLEVLAISQKFVLKIFFLLIDYMFGTKLVIIR